MIRILAGILNLLCCLGGAAHAMEKRPEAVDLARIKVLDLKTAQTLALVGNPDMMVAQSRIEQARARVRQAAATWWPSLDAGGSGDRQRLSDNSYENNRRLSTLIGGTADQTTENYSAGLQAT